MRFELTRENSHYPLKVARLPIPPPGHLSEKRDSNPRPQPWQGCALPTELFSHFVDRMCYPFFADAKLCIFIYSTMTFMKKILLTLIGCYTVYCVG